ncbi:MAG TPA: glycosyltransferase [Stellaceae bacterium]|nr:glycosyltransferase [Stellaceae bacterium]
MNARHIVVIPSWYSSGRGSGGGYFRDQALALRSAGHRIAILVPEIFTSRDQRAGRAPEAAPGEVRIEHDGIDVYRCARRVRMPRLPYRNPVAWSLSGLSLFAAYVARNGRPDLIHAHSSLNAGVLAASIRARYGVHFILTEHSTSFAEGRLRWWERDLVRRVARHADACIAVSPHLASLLQAQFPGTSWHYVPNVLGAPFLTPLAPRSGPASVQPFVFLCAARFARSKNQELLIDAFADAFAADPRVKLQLAGAGPMQGELVQLCARRGLAGQVEFLGLLSPDRLRAAMGAADAFVLVSDVETFGVVVIEAQAAGLPVVCTASGGPDHLIDTSNGLLIPIRDRASLGAALREMRDQIARYDRARISRHAIERFGPEAFVRRFSQIVDSTGSTATTLLSG